MLHTATRESFNEVESRPPSSDKLKANLTSSQKIEKMITEEQPPILAIPFASDKRSPKVGPDRPVPVVPDLIVETPHELVEEELRFEFDKYRQLFSVHRTSGVKVGEFSIPQVINLTVCKRLELPSSEQRMTRYLVDNLIGNPNTGSAFGSVFKTPDESSFMADIESVIRLNNGLFHFESKQMEEYVSQYPDPERSVQVRKIVKHFIFDLLHHTLKLLNMVVDKIKDDPSKKRLKQSISHYTVGIVYRITNFVHEEIGYYGSQLKKVNENYRLVVKSRETLGEKIDQLIQVLNKPSQPETDTRNFDTQQTGGAEINSSNRCSYEELVEDTAAESLSDIELPGDFSD